MTEITFAQIGWLLGIAGVAFGIWGQVRSGKQASDQANDRSARETATVLTKLDFMSKQMETMQTQLSGFSGHIIDLAARLGAVEKSAELAHTRLDKMEVDEP